MIWLHARIFKKLSSKGKHFSELSKGTVPSPGQGCEKEKEEKEEGEAHWRT